MSCANCDNDAEYLDAPGYASEVEYCAACLPRGLRKRAAELEIKKAPKAKAESPSATAGGAGGGAGASGTS